MGFHVSHSHEPKLKTNPHFSNLETKNILVNSQLVTFEPKNKQTKKRKQQNQTIKNPTSYLQSFRHNPALGNSEYSLLLITAEQQSSSDRMEYSQGKESMHKLNVSIRILPLNGAHTEESNLAGIRLLSSSQLSYCWFSFKL